MDYIAKTRELIRSHNIHIRKRFGQNFLVDEHILDAIIDAAAITKDDTIIEVGPGLGTMTRALADNAGEVVAIEIDRDLAALLTDMMKEYQNVTIICDDILKTDISSLVDKDKKIKVVANLPYYITTPIIMELLSKNIQIESITVMVQKEVAQRMQAVPATKDYGALSLAVQYYSSPQIVIDVPPSSFVPPPSVDSSVIHMKRYDMPPVKVEDEDKMFSIIRAAFNHRRKTLVNALASDSNLKIDKDIIINILKDIHIREDIRGEALSLEQFALLTDEIIKYK